MNKSKTCYATGRTNGPRDIIFKSITGLQKSDLPVNYSGCSLYWGRRKSIVFLPINLQSKLGVWIGKILSLGAKLISSSICYGQCPHTR